MKSIVFSFLIVLLSSVFAYGQTKVIFKVEDLPTLGNQKVGIRGSILPLDWSKSIELKKEGDSYSVELAFPDSKSELEFKFVLFRDDAKPTWENTPNRVLILEENKATQVSENKWNKEQVMDISALAKIDVQGLQEDFELIKTMVLDVHPGTYRYNSEAEISAALEELKNKFSAPITHQEAYLAISKLTAQLKCDHTKAGFNNQTRLINSIIHYQADKMPFTFQWVGEEMIVLLNASASEELQRGTKVLSINEVPVAKIRNQILCYIGADGATDKNRLYKSQVNAYDFRYNAFDIFYPLLYPIEDQKISLQIQQAQQKETKEIEVATLTREERFEVLAERYETFPQSRDDMWSFEMRSDSVAMLTLNSFGLMGWKAMTIDYKAFLADAFNKINQAAIQHLIIDIRENNGGNDEMAEELFTYLAKENYKFEREGRTRYVDFPEPLKPYIRSWGPNPWYYNLKPKGKKTADGYYVFKENFSSKRQNNKKLFKGKSYLLTSSANTSLAFYTAYRFKYQKIGQLIGEETGGNLNDINGGQILFLTLPNSNIEIDFPVMGGFTTESHPNTGVIPHIEVNYQLQDVIDQTDLEVKEVMKLINK